MQTLELDAISMWLGVIYGFEQRVKGVKIAK